jgi:tetratricopeptide (TPR) repeat protein
VVLTASGFAGCSRSVDPAALPAAPSSALAQAEAQRHVEAAEQQAARGNYDAAVDEYTAALVALGAASPTVQNDSVDPTILFQRGLASLQANFPDNAAADFSEVLQLRPDDGQAYAKRGEAFFQLGDLYKSVRDYTAAIRHGASGANTFRGRGEAYLARTQYDRAIADFEHAVKLDPALEPILAPQLAMAYRRWGDQLAAAGNEVEAADKLAQARRLDPALAAPRETSSDGEVHETAKENIVAREQLERGMAEWAAGRRDAALAAYTAAITAQPDLEDAYLRRGAALLAMGFPDTAVMDFRQAIQLGGDSLEAYRLLAQAYLLLENPHRTVISATDALHVDPIDAASYALRGRAYAELGQWKRAVADLNQAIALDPTLRASLQPTLDRAIRQRAAEQASNASPALDAAG